MSEAHKEYDTGAVRSSDCEDARYDLISPIGLRALAKTYAEGAKKFGPFNWENGMPATDMINHALTHIYKFLEGNRDEDHLGHAAWNILGAVHSLELWPHLNNQWLRGPNCTVPEVAAQPPAANAVDLNISQVASGVYAVGVTGSENPGPDLEKLRQAILGGEKSA